MDTTTQATLSVAHQNLSDDLAKVGQLIEPVNDRALAMLSRVQRRLLDIQELVKVLAKEETGAFPSIDKAETHLTNVYTLGELIAFYRPESEPDTPDFGNIYTNAGALIMQEITAACKSIEGKAIDA